MGFLDKLKFWKKDDDFGSSLDMKDNFSSDMGMQDNNFSQQNSLGLPESRNARQDNLGMPSRNMPDMSQYRGVGDLQGQNDMNMSLHRQLSSNEENAPFSAPNQGYHEASSDMQVISAKLDAIKATIDAINQRVANLERVAYEQGKNTW
ncbi:hypothetical protein GF323_05090 [Candidatus Woesearchaeota archaeon]|nr:hypothetical protein [Candidatus Woesearchaeota archaeon]